MLQYVDGFSCSLNQDSGSIVIHFTQKEPHIEESTEKMNIVSNPVASIIMEKHSAIALLSILQDVYGDADSLQDN
jgi:hypothetical protein